MAARLLRPIKKKPSAPGTQKPQKGSHATGQAAQDRFLRQMIDEHRKVAVFLASGVKLEGEIVSYDQYVILMKGALTDSVYKHAISTIQPVDAGSTSAKPPRKTETRAPTIVRRSKPRLVKVGGN
jgi:host factor-I protein